MWLCGTTGVLKGLVEILYKIIVRTIQKKFFLFEFRGTFLLECLTKFPLTVKYIKHGRQEKTENRPSAFCHTFQNKCVVRRRDV